MFGENTYTISGGEFPEIFTEFPKKNNGATTQEKSCFS